MISGRLPGSAEAPKQRIIPARTGHRRAPSTGGCLDTPETHLNLDRSRSGVSVRNLPWTAVRASREIPVRTLSEPRPHLRGHAACRGCHWAATPLSDGAIGTRAHDP